MTPYPIVDCPSCGGVYEKRNGRQVVCPGCHQRDRNAYVRESRQFQRDLRKGRVEVPDWMLPFIYEDEG